MRNLACTLALSFTCLLTLSLPACELFATADPEAYEREKAEFVESMDAWQGRHDQAMQLAARPAIDEVLRLAAQCRDSPDTVGAMAMHNFNAALHEAHRVEREADKQFWADDPYPCAVVPGRTCEPGDRGFMRTSSIPMIRDGLASQLGHYCRDAYTANQAKPPGAFAQEVEGAETATFYLPLRTATTVPVKFVHREGSPNEVHFFSPTSKDYKPLGGAKAMGPESPEGTAYLRAVLPKCTSIGSAPLGERKPVIGGGQVLCVRELVDNEGDYLHFRILLPNGWEASIDKAQQARDEMDEDGWATK